MRNRSDIKESGRNRGNIITGNTETGNTQTGNTLTGNTQKAKIVLLAMVLCTCGEPGAGLPMQLRTQLRTYLRIYPRLSRQHHPGNRREYSGCHNH